MTKNEPKFSKTTRKKFAKAKTDSVPRTEEKVQTVEKEFHMEKVIIGILLIGILAGVIYFSGVSAGYQVNGMNDDHWSPRNYVAKPGDCFVPPQGDPLYDAHYAQEVNKYNCEAFKDQSQAHFTDAQTRTLDWQKQQSQIGTSTLLFFGLAIIAFFVWVILK